MFPAHPLGPPEACPASAVILAARLAKTPLAIADARVPGAPLLFVNDAFADLVGRPAATQAGQPLSALTLTDIRAGTTTRFPLSVGDEESIPAALSTAAVRGADGAPFCLLCSLVDARGEGADEAIARDAALLAQVAQAASELMSESAAAADTRDAGDRASSSSDIALDALAHVTQADAGARLAD